MKAVTLVAPQSEMEHILEEPAGKQLQSGGDQRTKQEIEQGGQGPVFLAQTSVFRCSDQKIQQEKRTAVNGAEGQCHKAAVMQLPVAEHKKHRFRRPT